MHKRKYGCTGSNYHVISGDSFPHFTSESFFLHPHLKNIPFDYFRVYNPEIKNDLDNSKVNKFKLYNSKIKNNFEIS